MKTRDIPILKQRVLDLLPITQAQMWKKLGIGSEDGADIVKIMLDEKLIKRTRATGTFLLETNGHIKKKSFGALLHKGVIAPCIGCNPEVCKPASCGRLTKWLV